MVFCLLVFFSQVGVDFQLQVSCLNHVVNIFSVIARAAAPGQPGQEELHHLPDRGAHRDQRPVSDQSEAAIVSDSQSEPVIFRETPEPSNNTNNSSSSGAKLTTTVTNGNNSTGKLSSSHTETAVWANTWQTLNVAKTSEECLEQSSGLQWGSEIPQTFESLNPLTCSSCL